MRFKYSKTIRIFILSLSFIFVSGLLFELNAFSESICGLEATSYETQDKIKFINNINLHISKPTQTNNSLIVNADVSRDGYVAIALDNKSIVVYDDNGVLFKQFSFKSYGSYCVKWNENNLALFYIRDDTAVEFTLDCEITGVFYVNNISKTLKETRNTSKLQVNSNTYKLENKQLFSGGYAKLVKIDDKDNVQTLYNSTASSAIIKIVLILFFTFCFAIVLYLILRNPIKHIRKTKY